MYYKLLYRKEHLYLYGVSMILLWNFSLLMYYISILFFNIYALYFTFGFLLVTGLIDLLSLIKSDSNETDPIDKNLLSMVLIFLIILFFIFIFQVLSFIFILVFIIVDFLFSEYCLLYIHLKDLNKSKILTILEFNEDSLKIYEDQVLTYDITTKSIEKILFEYDEVIIRGDGHTKHRSYHITFKLGNRDYKLYYHKEKKEMIDFLLFLDEYCSHFRISFLKINKSRHGKQIEDLKKFFRLE